MNSIKRPPSMKEIMWDHYEATLRDDLAKAALPALIESNARMMDNGGSFLTVEGVASMAYYYADLMLKARKEKA